jgi:predicted RNase H-like nuclease (RuvC/YqgF family)
VASLLSAFRALSFREILNYSLPWRIFKYFPTFPSLFQSDQSSLEDLQKRVEALEIGSNFDKTQEVVQKEQMNMLMTLRSIREAMVTEGGSGNAAGSKELTALQEENEALEKKCAKQAYRIEHLCEVVEDLLKKTGGIQV